VVRTMLCAAMGTRRKILRLEGVVGTAVRSVRPRVSHSDYHSGGTIPEALKNAIIEGFRHGKGRTRERTAGILPSLTSYLGAEFFTRASITRKIARLACGGKLDPA
jgi:hypothetical protein